MFGNKCTVETMDSTAGIATFCCDTNTCLCLVDCIVASPCRFRCFVKPSHLLGQDDDLLSIIF